MISGLLGPAVAAALSPSFVAAPAWREPTRPPPRRFAHSLAAKLLALLVVFLAVPAILYGVFREADAAKNQLLIRTAQEEGRLIALALRSELTGDVAPNPDLSDALADFAADGRAVKVLFRPAAVDGSDFFYIAANPTVAPEVLQEERDRLDRQGVLGRLATTCALDEPTALRQQAPAGGEEVISGIVPIRTEAGCWVVVVSHSGGPLVDSSLGRSYWHTPEVRIAGAIYLVMALFAMWIFVRVWQNLQRFGRVAGEIGRRDAGAGSFSSRNGIPELAGVAAAIDEMVDDLGKLSHAVEHSASAVVIFDGRGRIEYANPATSTLTGYPAAELKGRSCRLLRGRGTSIASFMLALRTAAAGRTWHGEFAGRKKSGEPFWALASVAPSSGGRVRPTHFVAVLEDITERKRTDRQKTLLMAELNHRVKNTLATVRSIASQTMGQVTSTEAFREAFGGRLAALAQAHELLIRTNWEGADLRATVERALAPFGRTGEPPWTIKGPTVRLQPKQALALTLVLHELATNAAKYGALSTPEGHVSVAWAVEGRENGRLRLIWSEAGGPPVATPRQVGFGTRLIEGSISYELDGEARIDYRREGVQCTLVLPWPGVDVSTAEAALA